MTLSITVLVMEGTGALQLVVPMMLAVFVAKIVGDSVSMGVYDLHIKIRGAPVLVRAFLVPIEKKSKDYTFQRQFDEKPSIIPGCPGPTTRPYMHSFVHQIHGFPGQVLPILTHVSTVSCACSPEIFKQARSSPRFCI